MKPIFKTIKTTSELIVYRSAFGFDCCVPGKPISNTMLFRIPLNSEINYHGLCWIEKRDYDLWSFQEQEFITPRYVLLDTLDEVFLSSKIS